MVLRLRRKKTGARNELQSVLGRHEIPTFPGVVMRTIDTLRRPESSAADVAAVLSTDPGLTVRLLKLVNSAGFSPARPVTNVNQAVAVAGYGTVESLVLSAGVTTALPHQRFEGFDHVRFWRTSSFRATLARKLATEYDLAAAGLSFTAGLLQDMAIPLLAAAREEYRPVLVAWHAGEADLIELEQERFGWGHDQVGQWLCQEWELPVSLGAAIAGHHGRGEEPAPAAVQLVSSIREVAIGGGDGADGLFEGIPERAAGEFGYDATRVQLLTADAETEATELARILI